jgi:hypothetical protein
VRGLLKYHEQRKKKEDLGKPCGACGSGVSGRWCQCTGNRSKLNNRIENLVLKHIDFLEKRILPSPHLFPPPNSKRRRNNKGQRVIPNDLPHDPKDFNIQTLEDIALLEKFYKESLYAQAKHMATVISPPPSFLMRYEFFCCLYFSLSPLSL